MCVLFWNILSIRKYLMGMAGKFPQWLRQTTYLTLKIKLFSDLPLEKMEGIYPVKV